MNFSLISQFSQRSAFHVIFDGDDPSPPVAGTNSSDMIGLFRIEIHVLSCHTRNIAPAASFEVFPLYKD